MTWGPHEAWRHSQLQPLWTEFGTLCPAALAAVPPTTRRPSVHGMFKLLLGWSPLAKQNSKRAGKILYCDITEIHNTRGGRALTP